MQQINEIQKNAQKKGIKYLIHFTKIGNLESILDHGLVTRDLILPEYIDEVCNDQLRLDETNGICLSISFPNYKMLYSYRFNFPESSWIILRINPAVLWEKKCLFNHTNAASKAAKSIPESKKNGSVGFNEMFSDLNGKRSSLCIPENYTTDPQAEVIVLENIECEFIIDCVTSKIDEFNILSKEFKNLRFNSIHNLFQSRKDFEKWR